MARIKLPLGEGLDVARALTLAPQFAEVVAVYEKAVARTTLDRRLHELVRYRVAQLNDCQVCLRFRWDSGVDENVHDQVANWRTSDEFSQVECAALSFTEQFCGDSAAIPDELIAELEKLLSPALVVELTLVVGKYVAMGRFMQVLGLDQACDLSPARS
jgi:alkylhydroperoxidase family enzyme